MKLIRGIFFLLMLIISTPLLILFALISSWVDKFIPEDEPEQEKQPKNQFKFWLLSWQTKFQSFRQNSDQKIISGEVISEGSIDSEIN